MTYRLREPFIMANIGKGSGLMDSLNGKYYTLDAVGKQIFELLKMNGQSLEGLVDALSSTYEGDREVIEVDVKEFLEELIRRKLVVVGE